MRLKIFLLILAGTAVQGGYPSLWVQSQRDAAELATSSDATVAMNFIQNTRDAAEDFKAAKEGRPIHDWPHVDRVWYDGVTQLFHWCGPVTDKEMSMSRKQFMGEIWYPYFVWIDLHTSF
jgi:hypothetical protein